jgi:hypothetical protein
MHLLLRLVPSLLAVCAIGLLVVDPSLEAQTTDSKTGPEQPKKIPLDKLKVPPGGVVILVEEGKDVRTYFPKMVLLTPEKYQEITDRLALLEKQVKGERKGPYQCRLTAVVEGEVVRISAEVSLQTDLPRSIVPIGFRGTQLSEARLRPRDAENAWQPALVDLTAEGYTVTVEKAGDYQLSVELKIPLSIGPGPARGFDLALPGAAVTTLSLDLPAPVREVRWNKVNVEKPASGSEQKHWEFAVGKATQLQASWREQVDTGNPNPLRKVRTQVAVRIDELNIVTTAEFTLTDERAKAKDWRLWLPADAKLKLLTTDNVTVKQIIPGCHQLTLAQPTSDPIRVQVFLTQQRGPSKLVVGPLDVQDAYQQEGLIEVKLPAEVRRSLKLEYKKAAGRTVEELPPPRDQPGNDTVAVFKYSEMPSPTKGATPAAIAKSLVPPLEIELKTIQGKVETRVEHILTLRPSDGAVQLAASCKIIARPLDAPVDFLDVQLPPVPAEALPLMMGPSLSSFPALWPLGAWAAASQVASDGEWSLGSGSASIDLVYPDGLAKLQRKVRLKWAQPQTKDFNVTLVGSYYLPAGAQRVHLALPHPVDTRDLGATARMDVPENLELLTQDSGPEVPVAARHTLSRSWDHCPESWDLAWRPYRAEFAVTVVADVSFRPGYAHVKEQFSWDQGDRPHGTGGKAGFLTLKVPPEVKSLKVVSGGKLRGLDAAKQLAAVDVAQDTGKATLVVEYDFGVPTVMSELTSIDARTPLIWPEQATQADSKVRVWTLPTMTAALRSDGLAWKEVGLEVVPGRNELPSRVFQSDGGFAPLPLVLRLAPAPLAALVVDRALIQVAVDEEGAEHYRARYLVTKLNTIGIDVRLPIALKSLDPKFLVDGKELAWRPRDSAGLVAHLEIEPGLYGRPVVLEVGYQLTRGQTGSGGLWQSSLQAPVLEGQVVLGKVLWQVSLPAGTMAIAARGDAASQQRLAWRGWLPTVEPSLTGAELEQWITGQEVSDGGIEASLVSSAGTLEPLRVFRVTRAAWFLTCSGVVLLLGLILYARPLRPAGWLVFAGLSLVLILLASWVWTDILPVVLYGALPGVVLLALLLALQWMVHQRYRRQLVFMPGFTRVKTGSSLLRAGSSNRPREPSSTVDAPRPPDPSSAALK